MTTTPPNDAALIDVDNPAELKRWCEELGTTDEALQAAVKAVGRHVDQVKEYLIGGQAATQSAG